MVEAAAAISLVTSIASLIDLCAKVASRLHEFASKTSDVPQSFRSLSHRLPLLISTIQFISRQAEASRLSEDVTKALQVLIQSTTTQVSILETCLAQVTPPTDATRIRRAVKTLQSLTKDGKIRTVVEKIHQDIDFLVLHQSTQHVDTGGQILEALTRLQLGQAQLPLVQPGNTFHSISAHGHSHVHLGDIYHVNQNQEPDETRAFGLCWGSAPLIDVDNFIGRSAELDQMVQVLRPDEPAVEQRRLVLGGMGGIGKTQLAVAYARCCQASYTSVIWLNASTEFTLKESFRSVAQLVLRAPELDRLDDEQIVPRVHGWLANAKNTQWLLIFDNYDDPDEFIIGDYIPNAAHGSIVVTSRLPDQVRGQQMKEVRVQPIDNLDESLQILQTRSQRDKVTLDPGACRLAERLAGLPLALVTAGAYLRKTTMTFDGYLEAYDQRFNVNPRRPIQLQEYQDRTLYTTWNLSYSRLESDDSLAAKALKLLAYFDHQEIWYDLLHAGLDEDSPIWLQEMAAEQIDFDNVMGTLVDYCLLEAHPATRSYSLHNCVHDWTLAQLNENVSQHLYWYAVRCVAANIDEDDWGSLGQLCYARLTRHALRCVHGRFQQSMSHELFLSDQIGQISWVAELLSQQVQLSAAERLYRRALAGYETALGPDHTSTLDTVNNLGRLYRDQGKLKEAEQMYHRALAGCEAALGPDHTSTFSTVNNLGLLYRGQGKLKEAEQMHLRALAGKETALGPDHTSTLNTVNNLGNLYHDQGKLKEAEQMYHRALSGKETALGPDHTSILITVNNLGNLYHDQGKLKEAEQMYQRALAGYETALGPDHTSTLSTVNNLGNLYADQGKLKEAEHMYLRALAGTEIALGSDHTSTLDTVNNLGLLYADQGKLKEAEQMYERAMLGYQKTLGREHQKTLNSSDLLASIRQLKDERDDVK